MSVARMDSCVGAFSDSHRKEYVQWITDANIDAARQRRIATVVEWMAEGLPQNWRYQKKEDSGGKCITGNAVSTERSTD